MLLLVEAIWNYELGELDCLEASVSSVVPLWYSLLPGPPYFLLSTGYFTM